MKIVIDIPKDVIESAKSSPNYYPTYHFEKIWKAIANGTPLDDVLDKIRAEIERKANSGQWSEAVVYGMKKSIVIIDKHRAESGEQE